MRNTLVGWLLQGASPRVFPRGAREEIIPFGTLFDKPEQDFVYTTKLDLVNCKLQLPHIGGQVTDNRIESLRMIMDRQSG